MEKIIETPPTSRNLCRSNATSILRRVELGCRFISPSSVQCQAGNFSFDYIMYIGTGAPHRMQILRKSAFNIVSFSSHWNVLGCFSLLSLLSARRKLELQNCFSATCFKILKKYSAITFLFLKRCRLVSYEPYIYFLMHKFI